MARQSSVNPGLDLDVFRSLNGAGESLRQPLVIKYSEE